MKIVRESLYEKFDVLKGPDDRTIEREFGIPAEVLKSSIDLDVIDKLFKNETFDIESPSRYDPPEYYESVYKSEDILFFIIKLDTDIYGMYALTNNGDLFYKAGDIEEQEDIEDYEEYVFDPNVEGKKIESFNTNLDFVQYIIKNRDEGM